MSGRRCEVCGAVLSRYNGEAHCASCQREHDRTGSLAMVVLPDEVRGDPRFRAALEDGRWSEVLRMVIAAGVRQGLIAQASGISQSAVSRLTTGRSHAPGMATVRALCDALGVPRSWAGLVDPQEDPTDRRQLLTLGAASALSSALTGPDGSDAHLLGQGTTALRQLEQGTPTGTLIAASAAHTQLVSATRARAGSPREGARLAAREAEAAGLLAWLHVDLDESESARHCYRRAVEASERAHDRLLEVYMRASLADHATTMGAWGPAMALLRRCRDDLPHNAPDIAWAWLEATTATALAASGQEGAERCLRAAAIRLHGDAAEPVWPWLMRFDDTKLARYRARVAESRGDHRTAARLCTVAARGPGKQGAANTIAHARALAGLGYIEQAVDLACRAWDVAAPLGSQRTLRQVRSLHAELPHSAALAPLSTRMDAAW